MLKNKNIIYFVFILLVVIVAFYLLKTTDSLTPSTNQIRNDEGKIPIEQEIPKFIFGNVSRVEGRNIIFNVGTEEKTVVTDQETVLIKQVKENTYYKNIPAEFNEIKSSVKIVVYHQGENSDSQYKASKIQILDF